MDTKEQLHFHFSLSCTGEGNGNPLQCSCLKDPRDGEPGGLPSMGSHRVGHDCSDLAAAAVTWVDLEIVILSEISQTEKGKHHMISVCVQSKNNGTNEPIYKAEIESQK